MGMEYFKKNNEEYPSMDRICSDLIKEGQNLMKEKCWYFQESEALQEAMKNIFDAWT